MRNVSAITVTILLVASGSMSIAQWSWQNPSPQANDLEDVAFANEAIGFAVGTCGTILRTTDGGFSWAIQASGTAFSLHSVTSPDPLSAWAVGSRMNYSDNPYEQGVVLRTSDGGSTWLPQHTPDRWGFHGACFIDLTRGWVVGGNDTSVVIRTTDGGNTWTEQLLGITGPLWDVSFADGNHGIAVGSGEVVYRTTDGGEHWAPCSTGIGWPIRLNAVHLVDANHGWAVAAGLSRRSKAGVTPADWQARIIHTTDGGISWTVQLSQQDTFPYNLCGVSFRDGDRGFAVGMKLDSGWWAGPTRGIIYSTTDGGLNWTLSEPGFSTGWQSGYRGVHHGGSGGTVVVGNGGIILTTPDGGAEWQSMLGGTTNALKGVSFANATEGIAVGDSGTILRTTDSGARWTSQPSGTSLGLTDVTFIDQKHGWIVGTSQNMNSWGPGDSSLILSTSDGGATWVRRSTFVGTMQLVDLCFVDVNNGWAAGGLNGGAGNGVILRTTDGGNQWTTSTTQPETGLLSVHFIDSSTGWACGGSTIVKTTNAGNSWTPQQMGSPGAQCRRVFFVDDRNGWVAGNRVIRTTDGGANWKVQVDYSSTNSFSSIEFVDANNGWIGGGDPYFNGLVLTTTDGGAHWISRTVGTQHAIESISLCEDGQAWIAGGGGTILHTTDNGVTFVEGSPAVGVPTGFALNQNYPNPFNPVTKIRFTIVDSRLTIVSVNDLLGREVATLVNEVKDPGTYEVAFDASGLASGVYVCRLTAGGYAASRTMLLMK